jgi:hypothetical protein
MSQQDPLLALFYNLSKQLEHMFNIQWCYVHYIDTKTLSGFGIQSIPKIQYTYHFINLRVSILPNRYELDSSNRDLYNEICRIFPKIKFYEYAHYVEVFKDFIPRKELDGK